MLRICVYMHSRFVENHPIQILENGPLIFEWVLSHRRARGVGHRRSRRKSRVGGGRGGEESIAVARGRSRDNNAGKNGEGSHIPLIARQVSR
jgi:hypothetical protein